ncbi:MAG: hypothetical protein PVI90_15155 [Desulfobacteraceae bacterium]|jgi:paraquat-inducible protein B
MSKAAKFYRIALILLILVGCKKGDLDLQISFKNNHGLTSDAPVLFGGNQVGIVREVIYTKEGDYRVHISVNSNYENAATVDSKFYIVKHPKDTEKMIVLIEQTKPGGTILEEDTLVEGAGQRSFLDRFITDLSTNLQTKFEKLKKDLNKSSQKIGSDIESTMNSLSIQLGKLNQELTRLPEKDEVKMLGDSLEKLRDEMMAAEKSLRLKIQTEIIPQIEQDVDTLKKRLAPSGRDEEVEILEVELEKIKKI